MTENIKLTRDLALTLLDEVDEGDYAYEADVEAGESRWYSHHRLVIRRLSDGQFFASEDYHRGHTENQENDLWSGDIYDVEEEGFVHFHPVEKVAKTTYTYKRVAK